MCLLPRGFRRPYSPEREPPQCSCPDSSRRRCTTGYTVPALAWDAHRLRRFSLRGRLDAFFIRWLVPMYPCARRVGSADPTNQSENRSDVRSLVSPPPTLTRLHGAAACGLMPDGLPCDACRLGHIARSCSGASGVPTWVAGGMPAQTNSLAMPRGR